MSIWMYTTVFLAFAWMVKDNQCGYARQEVECLKAKLDAERRRK